MSSNLLVAAFVAITVALISCQEFNSSTIDAPTVVNITDIQKTESETASPPANIPPGPAVIQHEEQPQADQPQDVQTKPTSPPTRPPPPSTEHSTFPPVVHHITTTEVAAAAVTKPSPTPPASEKTNPEAEKPTSAGDTKKPDAKKPETTPAPKDSHKGAAGFIRESFILIGLSMCVVFGYLY